MLSIPGVIASIRGHAGSRPILLPATSKGLITAATLTFSLLARGASVWANPSEGFIVAISSDRATVNLGSRAGVSPGMDLKVVRDGREIAAVRAETVEATLSVGRIIKDDSVVVYVGDQVTSGAAPVEEADRTAAGGSSVEGVSSTSGPVAPSAPVSGTQLSLYVRAIRGSEVTLSAGADDGLVVGLKAAVRDGEKEIALLEITAVRSSEAEAKVIRQTPGQILRVGDSAVATVTAPEAKPLPQKPPAQALTLESKAPPNPEGLRHYTVPRPDATYDLLGALASAGLIQSVPARLFYDDLLLRHRAAEDLVLTRAQVAKLLVEALEHLTERGVQAVPARSLVAVIRLVKLYQRDLAALGYQTEAFLKQLQSASLHHGPAVSLSGLARARSVTHDGPFAPEPTDPEGGRLDLLAGAFADLGRSWKFSGRLAGALAEEDSAVRIQRALFQRDWGNMELEVGRNSLWYGTGRFGSLVLSDNAEPLDYVRVKYDRTWMGPLSYEGFVSPVESPSGFPSIDRTLYGHRIEWEYSPNVRFGLSDTLLTTDTVNAKFAAVAAYPIVPFEVIARDIGENVTSGFFVEANTGTGMGVAAEFLIDDFVLNKGEDSPNRLGYLLGAYWSDYEHPGRLSVSFEFARLDRRVYVGPLGWNNPGEEYYGDGHALGYPLADYDAGRYDGLQDFRFEASYMPIRRLTLGLGFEIAEYGTAGPVLSRARILRANAAYDFDPTFSVAARYRKSSWTNYGFVDGDLENESELTFDLSKAF